MKLKKTVDMYTKKCYEIIVVLLISNGIYFLRAFCV